MLFNFTILKLPIGGIGVYSSGLKFVVPRTLRGCCWGPPALLGCPGVIRLQFVAAASTTKGQGAVLAFLTHDCCPQHP